jgi:hypothetical protein
MIVDGGGVETSQRKCDAADRAHDDEEAWLDSILSDILTEELSKAIDNENECADDVGLEEQLAAFIEEELAAHDAAKGLNAGGDAVTTLKAVTALPSSSAPGNVLQTSIVDATTATAETVVASTSLAVAVATTSTPSTLADATSAAATLGASSPEARTPPTQSERPREPPGTRELVKLARSFAFAMDDELEDEHEDEQDDKAEPKQQRQPTEQPQPKGKPKPKEKPPPEEKPQPNEKPQPKTEQPPKRPRDSTQENLALMLERCKKRATDDSQPQQQDEATTDAASREDGFLQPPSDMPADAMPTAKRLGKQSYTVTYKSAVIEVQLKKKTFLLKKCDQELIGCRSVKWSHHNSIEAAWNRTLHIAGLD